MANDPQTVRIFISSPSDVLTERQKAKQVIAELQREYAGRLPLEAVLWEDLALPATASFQEGIDAILGERPIDIAVFILWARLGSTLGPAVTRRDGSPYRSGTETRVRPDARRLRAKWSQAAPHSGLHPRRRQLATATGQQPGRRSTRDGQPAGVGGRRLSPNIFRTRAA